MKMWAHFGAVSVDYKRVTVRVAYAPTASLFSLNKGKRDKNRLLKLPKRSKNSVHSLSHPTTLLASANIDKDALHRCTLDEYLMANFFLCFGLLRHDWEFLFLNVSL